MIKTIKKVLLSALSVLGVSVLIWVMVALNPNWVYAHETQVDFVTIHHNNDLEEGTVEVVNAAISIIEKSELYHEKIRLDLCLNDDSWYPRVNPLVGKPLGYAMVDKTVLYACETNFKENLATTEWAINNYELRRFDLTYLIAHEFTHNLQNDFDFGYVFKSTFGKINWKLEGHADYVSRKFRDDGKLREKITRLLEEEHKEHTGLPVFDLEDGTKQILSYFKYSLMVQYLYEVENLSYDEICADQRSLNEVYDAMNDWNLSQ